MLNKRPQVIWGHSCANKRPQASNKRPQLLLSSQQYLQCSCSLPVLHEFAHNKDEQFHQDPCTSEHGTGAECTWCHPSHGGVGRIDQELSLPAAPRGLQSHVTPHNTTPHNATPHNATTHNATPHNATPHKQCYRAVTFEIFYPYPQFKIHFIICTWNNDTIV